MGESHCKYIAFNNRLCYKITIKRTFNYICPKMTKCFSAVLLHCHSTPCSLHKCRVHAPQGTTLLCGTCHQDGRGPHAKTPALRRAPGRQNTPRPPEETIRVTPTVKASLQWCELELEEAASERT